MELIDHCCSRCGGDLRLTDGLYVCRYCGSEFDVVKTEEQTRTMREMLDEAKFNRIRNLRRNLYDATTAPYISTFDVKNACMALKNEDPDDFRANFFDIATGNNIPSLLAAIRAIDVEEYYDDLPHILRFLIESLNSEDEFLAINNLIERAYRDRDLELFEKYATMLSTEAERVSAGVYETKQTRQVFIAYSSKDMDKVEELVYELERNRISCFVAARNLRHGKGAVENYNHAIEEAMDHCRLFLFVSSLNSRSFSCDAWRIELEHLRVKDLENAPAEYRQDYAKIPQRYKKLRVQYMIQMTGSVKNAPDAKVNELFDGHEWTYTVDETVERVLKLLTERVPPKPPVQPEPPKPTQPPEPPQSSQPPKSSLPNHIDPAQDTFVLQRIYTFASNGQTPRGTEAQKAKFDQSKMRYVGLRCNYASANFPRTANLTWRIYKSDGTPFSDEITTSIQVKPGNNWLAYSWGWETAGQWPAGTYSIIASVNGSAPMRTEFEIRKDVFTNDELALSAASKKLNSQLSGLKREKMELEHAIAQLEAKATRIKDPGGTRVLCAFNMLAFVAVIVTALIYSAVMDELTLLIAGASVLLFAIFSIIILKKDQKSAALFLINLFTCGLFSFITAMVVSHKCKKQMALCLSPELEFFRSRLKTVISSIEEKSNELELLALRMND